MTKTDSIFYAVNSSSSKVSIATALIMTIIIIIDLLATRQILFFNNTWQTVIFIVTLIVAYGIGPLVLLSYTWKISIEIRAKISFINIMHLAVTITHFLLLGILLFIIYDNSINCPGYFSFCMVTRPFAISINAISSSWLLTAYLITAAVMTPIVGKLLQENQFVTFVCFKSSL
jgi:hypothetical protein